MKNLIKAIFLFAGIGAAFFLAAQFAGTSLTGAGLIYAATPVLTWLSGLWILTLAGLFLYSIFSGRAGEKTVPFLTGIRFEAPVNDSSANALKMSFSFIIGILLLVSLTAFVRIDVHTGYECEKPANIALCVQKRDTKRILFVPGITLPGSGVSYKTLPGAGNMVYFVANTPPVGGSAAACIAFLTLLFIGISRISLIVFSKRAAAI